MRVVFPYFAQLHQVFHSLPIAAEMARRHPDIEVHVAAVGERRLSFIRDLLRRHAPQARVQVDALAAPWLSMLPSKRRTMLKNRDYFRGFDAVVTPERTSLFLGRRVSPQTRLIWTRHGAGDRAIGFASDVVEFDYVLMAGKKIEKRLLTAGLVRPGHYTGGVYAKFDWLQDRPAAARLFANDRPTVLYNPHFDPELSSWPLMGHPVLERFARSERYNLIFAPHVRLFDPPHPRKHRAFARYAGLPHMRIDLGSERCIDMTYVQAADVYLGDVSSQVSEFVSRPRPCLFLNAHRVDWRADPNYRFWSLGPVLENLEDFFQRVDDALAAHGEYLAAQQAYVDDTFGLRPGEKTAARGADAIVDYLKGPRDRGGAS